MPCRRGRAPHALHGHKWPGAGPLPCPQAAQSNDRSSRIQSAFTQARKGIAANSLCCRLATATDSPPPQLASNLLDRPHERCCHRGEQQLTVGGGKRGCSLQAASMRRAQAGVLVTTRESGIVCIHASVFQCVLLFQTIRGAVLQLGRCSSTSALPLHLCPSCRPCIVGGGRP